MRIILDTHIFLWCLAEPENLSEQQRNEIETLANTVMVSAISIAELMIKSSLGKLALSFDPVEKAREAGFDLLDFSAKDALLLGTLPFHHRDPFDRMLIAQSISNNYPIISNDTKFCSYACRVIT
ncbi:MAG: type II toxin-antitoxin system VapC family toxin [Chitinispirillaceae bacterium]|nr:type II toxin-antitoxin system VapC family toxin [Chitinispirillaceae bacterium]